MTSTKNCVLDINTMEDKQQLKKAKNLFNKPKTDPASVAFDEELLDLKLLNKP